MEAKQTPIGRVNTVFGSLKWWASSPFHINKTQQQQPASKPTQLGGSCSSNKIATTTSPGRHFGSAAIAVQKLRESRWFGADESRLFCAVVESGFVVEIKAEGQENESTFGVVQFKCGKGR